MILIPLLQNIKIPSRHCLVAQSKRSKSGFNDLDPFIANIKIPSRHCLVAQSKRSKSGCSTRQIGKTKLSLHSPTRLGQLPAMAAATILDLDLSHDRAGRVLEDIVRLGRTIFPEHQSSARSLSDELRRRSFGLIYSTSGADGEEVAGYAVYTCNTSLCATIIELAVRENCRRQGHGEALLRTAVERCRGRRVQRVILHVDPARTAAVALYRKAGFQVDVTIEGYYEPQRDAYRMFMDLQ